MFVKAVACFIALSVTVGVASPQSDREEWNYSLALQAASWGAPLVTMYAFRYHDALGPEAKSQPNTIWKMSNISTPKLSQLESYSTPSVNVIYGFGFMDLRQEPIVLEVPNSNGRYYTVQCVDMWTNAFAYVGGMATGYEGGRFVLVGPNWKGDIPPNLRRIDCPTSWILVQPQVHVYTNGKLDLPGAKGVLNAITTTGLSTYMGRGEIPPLPYNSLVPEPVDPELPVGVLKYKDPFQFWKILAVAMKENPPPDEQITALIPMFAPLGIYQGKEWDPALVEPTALEAMKLAAGDISQALAELPYGHLYKGARIPPPTVGNFGTDYKIRAIFSRIDLTINTPEETTSWIYINDENELPLTGKNQYTLTFEKEIPFYQPGFWSITMYDQVTNYPVENPINRYMIGSDSPNLKKNGDGSFTIYIQEKNPGGEKESNWLPAPAGPFYIVGNVFAPQPNVAQVLTNPWGWITPGIHLEEVH